MCERQCRKASNKFYDTEAIMVEDDGEPHVMNFFEDCCKFRHAERKAPEVSGKRWRIMVGEKSSGQTVGLLGSTGIRK